MMMIFVVASSSFRQSRGWADDHRDDLGRDKRLCLGALSQAGDQLCRVGYCPSRVGHQARCPSYISKRGNCRLRTCLYMPALASIRSDEQMRRFYERLCQGNGGQKKAAIVAVARKLLRVFYAIWLSGEDYNPARI
ncbi:MAG: transposase [Candidatus Kapaibacterium sp.]